MFLSGLAERDIRGAWTFAGYRNRKAAKPDRNIFSPSTAALKASTGADDYAATIVTQRYTIALEFMVKKRLSIAARSKGHDWLAPICHADPHINYWLLTLDRAIALNA